MTRYGKVFAVKDGEKSQKSLPNKKKIVSRTCKNAQPSFVLFIIFIKWFYKKGGTQDDGHGEF